MNENFKSKIIFNLIGYYFLRFCEGFSIFYCIPPMFEDTVYVGQSTFSMALAVFAIYFHLKAEVLKKEVKECENLTKYTKIEETSITQRDVKQEVEQGLKEDPKNISISKINVSVRICPSCGTDLGENHGGFCPICGANFLDSNT